MALEIGHFRTFKTSLTLTMDWAMRHTFVYRVYLYLRIKFRSTRTNVRTDGPTDIKTDFIGSTRRAEST